MLESSAATSFVAMVSMRESPLITGVLYGGRSTIGVAWGAALPCLAAAPEAAPTLEERLAAAEAMASWVMPLGLLSVALALVVVWLALRMRSAPKAAAARSVRHPVVEQASEVTMPQPRRLAVEAEGAPPEAQAVDVDQQVDFFELLGQHEAAVAVLSAHIDGPGSDDMQAYLKLMQIHRRVSDPQSFEQVRKRYRRRFGAEAPEWLEVRARPADVDLLLPLGGDPSSAIDFEPGPGLDLDLSNPSVARAGTRQEVPAKDLPAAAARR